MYAIKIVKANDPNIPSCPAPLLSTFQVAMGWSNTSSALDIQWDLRHSTTKSEKKSPDVDQSGMESL